MDAERPWASIRLPGESFWGAEWLLVGGCLPKPLSSPPFPSIIGVSQNHSEHMEYLIIQIPYITTIKMYDCWYWIKLAIFERFSVRSKASWIERRVQTKWELPVPPRMRKYPFCEMCQPSATPSMLAQKRGGAIENNIYFGCGKTIYDQNPKSKQTANLWENINIPPKKIFFQNWPPLERCIWSYEKKIKKYRRWTWIYATDTLNYY